MSINDDLAQAKTLLARVHVFVTNPELVGSEKIRYCESVAKAVVLVGDHNDVSPATVLDAVEYELTNDGPEDEPDNPTAQQKLFWDYVLEMEMIEAYAEMRPTA